MAEPPPITIKIPINNNKMIIGASQNFFLAAINPNKSLIKSIFFFFSLIQILFASYLFLAIRAVWFSQTKNSLLPNSPFLYA